MTVGPDAPIAPLVRDALIMPETKPLDDLLTDMRRQRATLAVIADEFGRTAGIVTIEDIIEEIVGEIVDETDPVLSSIRQLVNGDWFVRGHVSLGDLKDVGIELPVDSDTYTTVGGYVFGHLGRLAQAWRPDPRQRLSNQGRVGAREPGGRRADPTRDGRVPRAAGSRGRGLDSAEGPPIRPRPPLAWAASRPSAEPEELYVVRALHRKPAEDAEGVDPDPGRGRRRPRGSARGARAGSLG